MATDFPPLAQLAAEEDELQLRSFTNDDAWELGSALVDAARRADAPVAIEISRNSHRLFHVALTGATPDDASWIERKTGVVQRFGHNSLYGAFPVLVRDVGPVGVVVVSGLPQVEDHRMVVAALRGHLAR